MIELTGWRMVVRLLFSQPAISMSLSPMMPMPPGTVSPLSAMAHMQSRHFVTAPFLFRYFRFEFTRLSQESFELRTAIPFPPVNSNR